MLCPCCRTELVITGQARLETLDEHICNPNGLPAMKNKYECPNESCEAHGKCCWNEWGEYYPEKYKQELPFINDNHAPFGSFQRRINVEIYKKDENYDLLRIGKWRFQVVFCYQANEDGDILKRRRRIDIWKRDDKIGGEILHIPGIRMLLFSIREFHHKRKHGLSYTTDQRDPKSWYNTEDWWRVVSFWYRTMWMKAFGAV